MSITSYSQPLEGGVWEMEIDYNWDMVDELVVDEEALLIVNELTLLLFHKTIEEFFTYTNVTFSNGEVFIMSFINYDKGNYWVITDHDGWRGKIRFQEMDDMFRFRLKYINSSTIEIINESPTYQKYFDVLTTNPKLKRRTT
jgi:hypothetical protein